MPGLPCGSKPVDYATRSIASQQDCARCRATSILSRSKSSADGHPG